MLIERLAINIWLTILLRWWSGVQCLLVILWVSVCKSHLKEGNTIKEHSCPGRINVVWLFTSMWRWWMRSEIERVELLYPESPHSLHSCLLSVSWWGHPPYTSVHKSVYVFELHQQHPSRRVLIPHRLLCYILGGVQNSWSKESATAPVPSSHVPCRWVLFCALPLVWTSFPSVVSSPSVIVSSKLSCVRRGWIRTAKEGKFLLTRSECGLCSADDCRVMVYPVTRIINNTDGDSAIQFVSSSHLGYPCPCQ